MRQERIDRLAGEAFALLMCLLRPAVRTEGPGARRQEPTLLPPQCLDLRLWQGRGRGVGELRMSLRCPDDGRHGFSWALPMPPGACVQALELRCEEGGVEPAGLCERREARGWFDLARRSGVPSALLSEDAPGVYGLEIAGAPARGVELLLRYGVDAESEEVAELQAHCEAGGASHVPVARARLVRLGFGRRLARLAGVVDGGRGGQARVDADRSAVPGSDRPWRELVAGVATGPCDVFAGSDRDDTARMMYRGILAGRPARLWGELRTGADAASNTSPRPPAVAEIGRLMAQYRCVARTEAERRALASEVARLGLDAGLPTLWTSFVAVAAPRDPGGERVFAAA